MRREGFIPSSSMPPKGGFVTTTSRSFGPQLVVVIMCCRRMLMGTSMPCKIIFVVHSKCGSGFFYSKMLALILLYRQLFLLFRICSIAQETAGATSRPYFLTESGSMRTINSVTARRIELARIAGCLQTRNNCRTCRRINTFLCFVRHLPESCSHLTD